MAYPDDLGLYISLPIIAVVVRAVPVVTLSVSDRAIHCKLIAPEVNFGGTQFRPSSIHGMEAERGTSHPSISRTLANPGSLMYYQVRGESFG